MLHRIDKEAKGVGRNALRTKIISIFSTLLIMLSLIVPGVGMAKGDSNEKVVHTSSIDTKVSERLIEQFENDEKVSFMVKFKKEADTKKALQEAGKMSAQEE